MHYVNSQHIDGPRYRVFRFEIESNGKKHDAFQVVSDCMDVWGEYIISKSLTTPELIFEERALLNFPTWHPKKRV